MLGVKYDDTTTWKIHGWLKDMLGHLNSSDEKFEQEDEKALPYGIGASGHEDVIRKAERGEADKSLK